MSSKLEASLDALNNLARQLCNIIFGYTTTNSLSPATRKLISGAALVSLIVLYLRRRNRITNAYISQPHKVGRKVVGNDELGVQGTETHYDIIIIGGGTAGCVLANRLSAGPRQLKVLMLEAGVSGRDIIQSRIPSMYSRMYLMGEYVHAFWTETQTAANKKTKFWPRAKLLGGCSSINAQMAQYGAPGDFDDWASIIGDEAWSWKNFSKYFRKFEAYKPRKDFPLVDDGARGKDGPVEVGYFNTVTHWCYDFIQTCVNAGIRPCSDFNGPAGTLGVGRVMTYITKRFQRASAETSYLTPDVLARPNLKVATHAMVTRILFDTSNPSGKPRAVGVEFSAGKQGPLFRATARQEVILSAGAVQSPHILLLSGIGPANHLKEHRVPVVLDLPGVGQRLYDHPIVDLSFKKQKSDDIIGFLRPNKPSHVGQLLKGLVQYFSLGGGILAMNFSDNAAFVRSDDPQLFPPEDFPEKLVDSTSALDSPDLEIFCTAMAYEPHGRRLISQYPSLGLHVYLLRPTSYGSITLHSNHPYDYPCVDPNYLATREDVIKLVRGVRLLHKLSLQEPLKSQLDHTYTKEDADHILGTKTDAELEALVRERVETVYHPTSTCRMAPRDQEGVVDAQLRVYGVDGLRVCDASIFPSIISGHTTGACYAVAEKLADDLSRL